jgi:protocatechuate 3,4-dioxygenase beta subunit
MNRNKFLSLTGLSFIGSLFFSSRKKKVDDLLTACNDPITPPVPVGPYYKDEKLNRINIIEDKKGTPIDYLFKVEDKNCKPIEGAIVDIWQCDNDGHYSDFEKEHTINQTWLRGYQVTDKNGECRFKSVFPGWYTNRITHVHAKVHINNQDVLITNFFFTKEIENEVYNDPIYSKGPNPTTLAQDYELRVDKDTKRHDTLLMNVTKDKNGHLIGSYKIAIG